MHGRSLLVLILVSAGCQPAVEPTPKARTESPPASRFDPNRTGSIRGKVTWDGTAPAVPPLRYIGVEPGVPNELSNPNAPAIDGKMGGVGQALVTLRGVDAQRSRPWTLPSVEVLFGKHTLEVRQGSETRRIGFVRLGDEITARASEGKQHILLGRQAAFFSMPLRDPGRISHRRLEKPGWVELSSGAGLYWLRGHLWVSEHPYVALTAADGSYMLEQVPTGKYELVCWLPDWHMQRQERNAESGEIDRLFFAPAIERVEACDVNAGETTTLDVRFSERNFHPK